MRLNPLKLTCLALALAGCAAPIDRKSDADLASLRTGPAASPQRNITNFTDGLRCMDQLLFDYGVRDVTLMMEDFQDRSNRVAAGTRDMMVSAVSDMTRRSRALRLQTFGTDNQNLVQVLQQAQKLNQFSIIPEYDLRGSITQFDEDLLKRQGTFSLIVQSLFGVNAGRTSQVSVLGFDASVIRTKDFSLVPGLVSKNTIALGKEEASAGDGKAEIKKVNLSFTFALNRNEGSAQAVRNMVELSGIELVGKLTRLPYWTCLGLDANHPEIAREVEDWFFSMRGADEKRKYFQEQLRLREFYDGPLDGKANTAYVEALAAYKRALGANVEAGEDIAFFKRFLNSPVPKPPGEPFKFVAEKKVEAPAAVAATPSTAAAPPASSSPLTLIFDRAVYKAGEAMNLSITTVREGYLYCYTQDAKTNAIQRIFPNRFASDPRVELGQTVSLPGAGGFKIEAAAGTAQKQVACLLAPREVYNGLPPPLRWGDFEDIRLPSFEAIQKAFAEVAKSDVAIERASVRIQN